MRRGFYSLIFTAWTTFAVVACAQPTAPGAAAARSPGPAPFPSRVLRQTTFNIPFTVETARQPLEVQLHLSRDRGQTWKLYARQNPSARFFPFHATEDGEYWFASQTIDGTRSPTDIRGRQPELHVVIDTVQPTFDLQAVIGPSREIQVSWQASDSSIDPTSLKIEYQAGREQPWLPVRAEQSTAANSTVAGRLSFVPQNAWVELQVRAEISDRARNKTVVTRRLTSSLAQARPNRRNPGWHSSGMRASPDPTRPVALPPTTPDTSGVTIQPADDRAPSTGGSPQYPVGFKTPPIGLVPTASVGSSPAAAAAGIPIDPYANARPSPTDEQPLHNLTAGDDGAVASPSNIAPTTEWKSTNRPAERGSSFQGTAKQGETSTGESLDELVEGNGYQPQPSQVHPLVSQQIAGGAPSDRSEVDATAPSALRTDSNRVSVLPLRMTSAMRFELDYEFDAAAANGVRSVELWGTKDEGQTWSRWQVDDDRRSPLDVQVDAEGIFGFRIVIVGNNGLAGDAPRNGDDADLWVGIDTTAPVVRIDTATYGEGEHAGQLAIHWTAVDASFGENPITILFSDKETGPWTTIAAGIPNSGQFFWPIDPRVPEQLFLRIEARDRAGNEGEYRLPDSVNLAGFTPKARIRGIRPVTNSRMGDSSDLDSAPQATRNAYPYR